jgi:hypothetical protein
LADQRFVLRLLVCLVVCLLVPLLVRREADRERLSDLVFISLAPCSDDEHRINGNAASIGQVSLCL